MITFQKYTEILKSQGILEKTHSSLTNLIYRKGEEQLTEPLVERLGEIINGIDGKNYSAKTLNNFTRTSLGIEGQVMTEKDSDHYVETH